MAKPLPLFGALDEIREAVESTRHLLLLLDFDGTLAPLAQTPELARMPAATRGTLRKLAQHEDITVSIISGRARSDLRQRVGIDDAIYAGNHGLEISGGGLHFDHPAALAAKNDVERAVSALTAWLSRVAGVLVEPKGLTASVHYRRVHAADHEAVERAVRTAVPVDHPNLVVDEGKMVWEVRPRVAWNKGTAVRWIRDQLNLRQALTVYIGDDRTDEDAFAEIGRFVSVCVGPADTTRAGYQLDDSDEVAEFLLWLARTSRFTSPTEPKS